MKLGPGKVSWRKRHTTCSFSYEQDGSKQDGDRKEEDPTVLNRGMGASTRPLGVHRGAAPQTNARSSCPLALQPASHCTCIPRGPQTPTTGHFAFRGRSGRLLLLLLPPGGGWASSPTPSGTTTGPAPTPPLPLGWWGA